MKNANKISASWFDEKLQNAAGITELDKDIYFLEKKDSHECNYNFSNTTFANKRYAGCIIKNRENLIVDGKDSQIIYRGHLTPFIIDSSRNVVIKNLTIDFDPPFVAEAEVVKYTDEYVELVVDSQKYPYTYRDNWLYFDIGAEEDGELVGVIRFSKDLTIAHSSGDNFIVERVEETAENTIRIFPKDKSAIDGVETGDVFVLRHNERIHPGIFIENCKNITLENITIHSCGGLGILTQFCENVTYRNIRFIPNRSAGRKISGGRDDGMHITSCRGKIVVEGCSFVGLMDDPINIHGCSMLVEDIFNDGKTLRARYMHPQAKNFQYYAIPGDVINIINQKNMSMAESAVVESFEEESENTIILNFNEPISSREGNLAIENISCTAEFVCRKNRFGSCRARGLLVSTPKKVLIEKNLFESSGSAVLVAGDANYWYESGECHDIMISQNVFTNHCLSSMYEFTHGMISICPVVPKPDMEHPFHKNICIKDNVFDTSDTPVLYAFSTDNLVFSDNTIFANPTKPNASDKTALINLNYCSNAIIQNNTLTGEYSGEDIECEHCNNVVAEFGEL